MEQHIFKINRPFTFFQHKIYQSGRELFFYPLRQSNIKGLF